MNKEDFEKYLNATLEELMSSDESFIRCPSCKVGMEKIDPKNQNLDAPANEEGPEGFFLLIKCFFFF